MKDIPKRIVFLCSGNICRSPFAEVYARLKFNKLGLSPQIISMGVLGIHGRKAEPHMVKIAAEFGCDLTQHRSQGVTKTVLNFSDLIFIMDNYQYQHLQHYAPNCVRKIRWLGDFLQPPHHEILDPMGKPEPLFRAVAQELAYAIDNWIEGFKP